MKCSSIVFGDIIFSVWKIRRHWTWSNSTNWMVSIHIEFYYFCFNNCSCNNSNLMETSKQYDCFGEFIITIIIGESNVVFRINLSLDVFVSHSRCPSMYSTKSNSFTIISESHFPHLIRLRRKTFFCRIYNKYFQTQISQKLKSLFHYICICIFYKIKTTFLKSFM